jgi:hypothetical protein
MKHKKNVTSDVDRRRSAKTFKNSTKKKTVLYFQWFRSYKFFNEALHPRFFAKKMTLVKRMTDT